jgi:hypothetical protein
MSVGQLKINAFYPFFNVGNQQPIFGTKLLRNKMTIFVLILVKVFVMEDKSQ